MAGHGCTPTATAPCRRWSWLGGCGGALLLAANLPAVLAGSITAESIWDRQNALDRAREQVPPGAVITGERCQVVEVGMGNDRYICTVDFRDPPPASAPGPSPTGESNAPAP